MLDYKQFLDIVGPEKIEQFKNIKNVVTNESHPEEFFVLYRLYEKLKKKDDTIINEVSNDANQLLPENNLSPSHEVVSNINNESQQQEKSKSDYTLINNSKLTKSTENVVDVKQFNISPIESVLIWPLTPERKGTRITERIPFVISSQKWQTLYEEKEKRKRTIEEEKENKKQKRLENIQAKKLNKNNLRKSNIVKDIFKASTSKDTQPETLAQPLNTTEPSDPEDEDIENISSKSDVLYTKNVGVCFTCATNLNDIDNGLECTLYTRINHLKCLDPKEYCCLGSDEILYICDGCQKNVNN